mgnify:CR=1 FL=1
MRYPALEDLHSGKITQAEAYTRWHTQQHALKKARFVKLRIFLKDQKAISMGLNTLFALPLPIALAKPFIRRIKDPQIRAMADLIQYAKGTRIDVQSKEAMIRIAII